MAQCEAFGFQSFKRQQLLAVGLPRRLQGERAVGGRVDALRRAFPFRIERGASKHRGAADAAIVSPHGARTDAIAVSASVLQSLRQSAERQLGAVVRAAVVTIPAHFGHAQRDATLTAASARRGYLTADNL